MNRFQFSDKGDGGVANSGEDSSEDLVSDAGSGEGVEGLILSSFLRTKAGLKGTRPVFLNASLINFGVNVRSQNL